MSLILSAFAALQLAGASAGGAADFTPVRVADSDIRGAVRALHRGEWRNALHFADAALEDGPRRSVRIAAHANRCIALWGLDRRAEAIAACETAAELAPDNALVVANLSATRTRLAVSDS